MTLPPFRRIVTGHDAEGRAIIQSDAPPPRVRRIGGPTGPLFHEVWNTRESPARIDRAGTEPAEDGIVLAPPKGGTRIRVLDFPAETLDVSALSAEDAAAHFAEVGAAGASRHGSRAVSDAFMHRTATIDYGIVLDGELVLLLDDGEVLVRAGDIVIQRGTNHGWANRSGRPCRIAFILIDGAFDPDLA